MEFNLSRIDEYRSISRVYFGVGSVNKAGEVAKEIAQNPNTLIITDKALSKIGLVDAPKKSLEDAGFTVNVYESEAKEPILEEVKKAIEAVREGNYGLVVGLGGGSAMDIAKAAAVLADSPGELEEYIGRDAKPLVRTKPKLLIPTTSGTGSESSIWSVITVPHKEMGTTKTSLAGNLVLADAAVVDPSLTVGLPPRMTAGSGMDAISHNAEAVLSLQANPFSDAISLKAVELISQNLKTAYHQGDNIVARWNMAFAAFIGGMVISYPWVSGPALLGHVASEGISTKYGVPHGEACGTLLPFVYWYNLPDAYGREKLVKIAEAMGEDITGLDTKKAAQRAITATFNLLEDINLPTSLKEYNIPMKDIPLISEYIFTKTEARPMSKFNPRKATLENITEFFNKALEGRESIGF